VTHCPECRQPIREMSTYEASIQKALLATRDWFEWMEICERSTAPMGPYSTNRGEATLVDWDVTYDFDYAENVVFMVFEVEGDFFMKSGVRNSYGDESWEGRFMYVTRADKKATEWVVS
jgi:hypothetical protein